MKIFLSLNTVFLLIAKGECSPILNFILKLLKKFDFEQSPNYIERRVKRNNSIRYVPEDNTGSSKSTHQTHPAFKTPDATANRLSEESHKYSNLNNRNTDLKEIYENLNHNGQPNPLHHTYTNVMEVNSYNSSINGKDCLNHHTFANTLKIDRTDSGENKYDHIYEEIRTPYTSNDHIYEEIKTPYTSNDHIYEEIKTPYMSKENIYEEIGHYNRLNHSEKHYSLHNERWPQTKTTPNPSVEIDEINDGYVSMNLFMRDAPTRPANSSNENSTYVYMRSLEFKLKFKE